jgi:hypothetical protein
MVGEIGSYAEPTGQTRLAETARLAVTVIGGAE